MLSVYVLYEAAIKRARCTIVYLTMIVHVRLLHVHVFLFLSVLFARSLQHFAAPLSLTRAQAAGSAL